MCVCVVGVGEAGPGRDGSLHHRHQSEEEMFSAPSDSPEEEDDYEDPGEYSQRLSPGDTDEYVDTLSPGYTAAAASPTASCDYGVGNDEFPYEVLSADQLVQQMVDCIKDVNTIVQVAAADTASLELHQTSDILD